MFKYRKVRYEQAEKLQEKGYKVILVNADNTVLMERKENVNIRKVS